MKTHKFSHNKRSIISLQNATHNVSLTYILVLANAKTELKSAELFDYIVLNKDFDKALKDISAIIFEKHYENNQVNINILEDLLD